MHSRMIDAGVVVLGVLAPVVAMAEPQPKPTAPPPPAEAQPQEKLVYVEMITSLGEIVLELNREKAPITVENFLAYADAWFYDGTIFHRVIRDHIIQGGGYAHGLVRKPTRVPIANEWKNGLKNTRGSIAMARTLEPDTATSQFYINVVDNLALDGPIQGGAGYAVFGRVVAGMDVVDKIRVVPTGLKQQMKNVPIEDVVLESVRRLDPEDARKRIEAENKGPAAPPDG